MDNKLDEVVKEFQGGKPAGAGTYHSQRGAPVREICFVFDREEDALAFGRKVQPREALGCDILHCAG